MMGFQDDFPRGKLPIEDWVLLVIDNMPDKTLRERHNFQNKMYFLSVLCKTNFDFGPHYFGPYSTLIANAIDMMTHLDFLKEIREKLPNHLVNLLGDRYSFIYEMADDGKVVMPEIYEQAESIGCVSVIKDVIAKTQDVEPKIQSSACKCHYAVYYQRSFDITPKLMKQIMKGWTSHNIEYKDMSKVIALLESLGLDRRDYDKRS